MLVSMCLSIAFIVVDTCAVLDVFHSRRLPTGVEPFWKVTQPASQARFPSPRSNLASCPSSSNASATPSSSTTSRPPSTPCVCTGSSAAPSAARSSSPAASTRPCGRPRATTPSTTTPRRSAAAAAPCARSTRPSRGCTRARTYSPPRGGASCIYLIPGLPVVHTNE